MSAGDSQDKLQATLEHYEGELRDWVRVFRRELLSGVVCFGTLAGSMLPFLLRRLGFDPATSSAPFVATLVDVSRLVIYFQIAALILRGVLS